MNPNLKLNLTIRTRASSRFDESRNIKQYDHIVTIDGREIVIPWKDGFARDVGPTCTWYVLRTQNVIFRKGAPLPSPGDIVIYVTMDMHTFLQRSRGQSEWSWIEASVPYFVISRTHCPKFGYRFLLVMICAVDLIETQAARYVEILI